MNSICIATYNGEKYIHEQLSSILSQINIDDEIIISDDNSTDKTIEIIKSINDPRIRVINGHFRNFTFNFENAIKQAKGEYLIFLDSDDWFYSNDVLECIAKELKKNKKHITVYYRYA